ncbi:MAG TPA: FAD-binding oxidoreductase [Streptosporangiaceae bacterium]
MTTSGTPSRRRFLSASGLLAGAGVLGGAGSRRSAEHRSQAAPAPAETPDYTRLPPIYPDDPRYPTMRMGFNRRWVGAPAYIQVVRSAAETVAAVQRAHDAGRRITVRGGGHCYENFSAGNDGGVLIDLSGMQAVRAAPDGRAVVAGGATLWNVYETLFKDANLTMPGGSCYSVGAGGHIVGGGYGLLSRLHGLTVDYLTGVDVVCVNRRGLARLVRARKGDPETGRLLWAHTGGGGGNFGIVTAYHFSGLPSPPEQVVLATTIWPWSRLTEASFGTLLHNYGQFLHAHSAPSSRFAGLFSLLALFHHSAGHIRLVTQAAGPASRLLPDFLAAMTRGVPGSSTSTVSLPWLQATQTLNGSGPNQRGKYKSAYLNQPFPADQIRATYAALTDPRFANPQALLQIDSYGGQVNVPAPSATAVPQRSSIMKLQYQTYWAEPKDDQVNLRWINDFYARVYAATGGVPVSNGVTDGCYVNYPDVDLPSTWPTLYYKDNYPALQAVKARWDPHNVFNHAQSIKANS